MNRRPKILVVGSFVMDLIVSTEKFPGSGETVLGKSFRTAPGGKGANQAVQAARLGADVTMVGKVGDDSFGRELIASAQAAGIRTQHILQDPDNPSAIGNILLEVSEGQKSKIASLSSRAPIWRSLRTTSRLCATSSPNSIW